MIINFQRLYIIHQLYNIINYATSITIQYPIIIPIPIIRPLSTRAQRLYVYSINNYTISNTYNDLISIIIQYPSIMKYAIFTPISIIIQYPTAGKYQ